MNKYLRQWINETYPLAGNDIEELDHYDLQKFADWMEKQFAISGVSNSCDLGDTSILIKGLETISNWDEEQDEWYDDPGHCANMTLIKYYNSKK